MKKLTQRDWKALTLLSIIVPVGLLISFRLTGMLSEPEEPITIAETTTLDPIKWEFKRVTGVVDIREKIEGLYNADVLLNQSVFISRYDSGFGFPYGNNVSVVALGANITAAVANGFVESISIVFHESYEPSQIDLLWVTSKFDTHMLNLSLQNWACRYGGDYWTLENNTKAFIDLSGISRPNRVQYWTPFFWVLRSPVTHFHDLKIVYEVTYFNGTVYKKVVQPFLLNIVALGGGG